VCVSPTEDVCGMSSEFYYILNEDECSYNYSCLQAVLCSYELRIYAGVFFWVHVAET
jgi:hypothetical protein